MAVRKVEQELERLGLPAATEADLRKQQPDATGLLVVDQVMPDGPADLWLQPGDVLLTVDGKTVTTFVPLDEAMDSSVGQVITLGILRGGKPLTLYLCGQALNLLLSFLMSWLMFRVVFRDMVQ